MSPSIPPFVPDDLAKLGITLDAPVLDKLATYLDRLLDANQRFNLTAIRDRDTAWRRHIIDSLTLLPGLEGCPPGRALIDVGSGGGLPGVPLAIARPDARVTLLEVTGKKANFLRECIRGLPLPHVSVVQERAEKAGHDKAHRQHYGLATCRAIGPMSELLEYALPLLRVGGVLLAMKGPSVEGELAAAGDAIAILGAGAIEVFDAYPKGFGQNTVIVRIVKERPTPSAYPRLPGVPRQSPL